MRADEHAAREEARRLEAENPLWIVIFGVYSREYVCFPRFGLDGGTVVAAKNPGALLPRMRKAERFTLGIAVTPKSGRINSLALPYPLEKPEHPHG